jgi:ElaB/YqjD/DUF883 family membrane-anchored ribosome-binding protein
LVGAVQIEDLSRDGLFSFAELSSEKGSEHVRRDIKIALERIRRDMDHARRDLASASKNWVDTTSKFVQHNAPKVSATIDETLEKTSETFKRTITSIDSETKPQQVKLLRAYKSFLSKQVDVIEKRLKNLKG